MSESLMFALLGFLIACLFGTVFASLLWRRAVAVTTRRITGGENFASGDEVAGLRSEIRDLNSKIGARDRDLKELNAQAATLEAARSEAEASVEGATEALKRDLGALESTKEELRGELLVAQAALQQSQTDLTAARDRIALLESGIRTLARSTSPPDDDPGETEAPAENAPPPAEAAPASAPDAKPDTSVTETAPDTGFASERADDEQALDVSRSLEERIEALKLGQPTH